MNNKRIKLICNNSKCAYKSPVYRAFNSTQEFLCNFCGSHLSRWKSVANQKQNQKAKEDLKEWHLHQ